MNIDQPCCGEEGHVSCTQRGLGVMCGERRTKQDEENGEDRSGEERCQSEGEKGGLFQ